MTNTQAGVGLRRMIYTLTTPRYHNFEANVDPTVQYKANREPLEFLGTKYHQGDLLSFDVAGTSYSKAAVSKLHRYFEMEWVNPAV